MELSSTTKYTELKIKNDKLTRIEQMNPHSLVDHDENMVVFMGQQKWFNVHPEITNIYKQQLNNNVNTDTKLPCTENINIPKNHNLYESNPFSMCINNMSKELYIFYRDSKNKRIQDEYLHFGNFTKFNYETNTFSDEIYSYNFYYNKPFNYWQHCKRNMSMIADALPCCCCCKCKFMLSSNGGCYLQCYYVIYSVISFIVSVIGFLMLLTVVNVLYFPKLMQYPFKYIISVNLDRMSVVLSHYEKTLVPVLVSIAITTLSELFSAIKAIKYFNVITSYKLNGDNVNQIQHPIRFRIYCVFSFVVCSRNEIHLFGLHLDHRHIYHLKIDTRNNYETVEMIGVHFDPFINQHFWGNRSRELQIVYVEKLNIFVIISAYFDIWYYKIDDIDQGIDKWIKINDENVRKWQMKMGRKRDERGDVMEKFMDVIVLFDYLIVIIYQDGIWCIDMLFTKTIYDLMKSWIMNRNMDVFATNHNVYSMEDYIIDSIYKIEGENLITSEIKDIYFDGYAQVIVELVQNQWNLQIGNDISSIIMQYILPIFQGK